MFIKALIAVIIMGFGTASLGAADSVSVWTAAELKNVSADLAARAKTKSVAGTTLGAFGSQSCAIWRRTSSGEAELHKVKTDLLVIQEGGATLMFGGTIPDARTTAPNEVRGASIRGGQAHAVAAGDIIRIPPGTPHQFLLAKGQTVTYFALKIDSDRSATIQ